MEIKENGRLTLQQSTLVRWISMIQLSESLLESFQLTRVVLSKRKQLSPMANINEAIVQQLIRLLKPFKHVVQIVQKENSPSLYMVLICTLTLRETLSLFDALMNFNREYETKTSNNEDELNESVDLDEHDGKYQFTTSKTNYSIFLL